MSQRDQGVLARAAAGGPPLYFYTAAPDRSPAAVVGVVHGYGEYGARYLRVMDASAVAMCRDNRLAIVVFNLNVHGNIMRMSMGEPIGTLIH